LVAKELVILWIKGKRKCGQRQNTTKKIRTRRGITRERKKSFIVEKRRIEKMRSIGNKGENAETRGMSFSGRGKKKRISHDNG